MNRFKNSIRDALFSLGFYRPVKKLIKRFKDPRNQRNALRYVPDILARSYNVFEENSEAYWLDYGTLLGFERQNALLLGDDDLDFGVRTPGGLSLSKHMEREGMKLVKQVLVEGYPSLEQYRYRGFRFDVFYYREVEDQFVTYLWLPEHYEMPQPYAYEKGLATLSEIRFEPFGTRRIEFYGKPFCVPEDPGKYLAQHYGADYMVPRPDFGHADEQNRFVVHKEHEVAFYA